MLEIYAKRIDKEKGESLPVTEEIVPRILEEKGFPGETVKREEGGRPYVEGCGLYISISHSDDMWVMALSDKRVGLDFQYIKERDLEAISKRFYSERDHRVVMDSDDREGSFFDIWVRREALGKYTGKGFFGVDEDLTDGKKPLKYIETGGEKLEFHEIGREEFTTKGASPVDDFRCVVIY